MNRRTFIAGLAATTALAGSVLAAPALVGQALAGGNAVTYSPAKLQSLMASDKTILLDFSAEWCTTCKAQERVINSLMGSGAYANVTVMRVDWDTNRDGQLVKDLQIPRRSTLVLLKGNKELGRVVAQTSEASIKGLLDKAA